MFYNNSFVQFFECECGWLLGCSEEAMFGMLI